MRGQNEKRVDKVSRLMERNGISSRKDDRLAALEKALQEMKPSQEQGAQDDDKQNQLTELIKQMSEVSSQLVELRKRMDRLERSEPEGTHTDTNH